MTRARRDGRHLQGKLTFRPTTEIRDAAQLELTRADWTMHDFLSACMVLLAKNPEAMLMRLADFRPPRKRGRPPKDKFQDPA
jgi:hypothetical protein